MKPLVMMELFLIVLVFVGLPLYSACMRRVIQASTKRLTAKEVKELPEQLQGRYIEVPDRDLDKPATYIVDPGASAGAGLRAFNLPLGSIRGMLALLAVGSFVIVLTLGGEAIANFDQVVTAFGTLTGAIIGFYFGGRSSTANPDKV